MTTRVTDSHLHLWDLAPGRYAWLGPEHGDLHRSFGPEEAAAVLAAAGVGEAVLVQAEDSTADTEAMLDIAEDWNFVAGVVGWIRLDVPDDAARQLERWAARSGLRGIRHLVHDDPRDGFFELPQVRRSLALAVEQGLPLDVPDAWPRHLHRLPELVDAVPGLVVVLDHLGKPPRGTASMPAWESEVRELAARPGTVAKFSGLQTPGQPFTTEALRPVWEVALDCFGPSRLMYGGDWPMTVPVGGYLEHWHPVRDLIGELTDHEQAQVLDGTARRTYRLSAHGAGGDQASVNRAIDGSEAVTYVTEIDFRR